MQVDSHVHFWKYEKARDSWMDDMKLLQKDYLPSVLEKTLTENNMNCCVAVQAGQSESETEFLIALAADHPVIKGVIGWIDLQSPRLEERLSAFSKIPVIRGWRHIVQGEPDGFMSRSSFRNGISMLGKFNYTYDILVYHHQLEQALDLVEQFPHQPFVIDHCAKPAVKDMNIDQWSLLIRRIAAYPQVHCKLSGLLTEAKWGQWNKTDFYPYFDVVFGAFGTNRVLFGSDWPVMLVSGSYRQWKELVEEYLLQRGIDAKSAVMGANAVRFYGLDGL